MSPAEEKSDQKFSKRLALLQFYTTTITGLVLMIFRSDPEKYYRLVKELQGSIARLQELGKERTVGLSQCDDGEERCTSDGLCHPKNDPTCCDISLPLEQA